jgi:hypothetical protein
LSLATRTILLPAAAVVVVVAGFLLTSPIPQDPAYHQFADARRLFAVDNFWNVASNLPFLIVGLWGFVYVFRHGESTCLPGLEAAYIVFYTGIFLTAFGSGYYHLRPENDPLVWDRLPMTIGFAGLFSIIVGEFVSVRIGRLLVIPLLLIGAASVEYWAFTEARGAGDLRPYAVVQFLPMLLIPAILLIYKPAIGAAKYYWLMISFYILAKIFEHFDAAIYAAGILVSGHTLKHFSAAMAPAIVLYALAARRRNATADIRPSATLSQ